MRRILAFTATLLLALAIAPPAIAKDHGSLYYLPQQSVSLQALLAPPPEQDSKQEEYDARKVSEVLIARTPADMAQVASDAHRNIFVFTQILGPNFNQAHLPLTVAMFARVNNDTEILIDIAKAHFLRQRPPGTKQTHFSYPSGHAAFAACTAILLSEMVPEKRGEQYRRAPGLTRFLGGLSGAAVANALDLVLHDAARGGNVDRGALLVAHQGAAER